MNTLYVSVTQFDVNSNSEITVSHSSDGGVTWTTTAVAAKQLLPSVDQFSDIAIGKDGTVYVSWLRCAATGPAHDCGGTTATVFVAMSSDGGNTWSTPVTVASPNLAPDSCGRGFYGCLPNTYDRVNNGPAIGIDKSSGSHAGRQFAGQFMGD